MATNLLGMVGLQILMQKGGDIGPKALFLRDVGGGKLEVSSSTLKFQPFQVGSNHAKEFVNFLQSHNFPATNSHKVNDSITVYVRADTKVDWDLPWMAEK